jgi:hypothetical protein
MLTHNHSDDALLCTLVMTRQCTQESRRWFFQLPAFAFQATSTGTNCPLVTNAAINLRCNNQLDNTTVTR